MSNTESPSAFILIHRIEVVEFEDTVHGTLFRAEFVAPSGKRLRCICDKTRLSGFPDKDDAVIEAQTMAEVTGLSIYHTKQGSIAV